MTAPARGFLFLSRAKSKRKFFLKVFSRAFKCFRGKVKNLPRRQFLRKS